MPYLGDLSSNFEKLSSYLKSTPSNLSHCKVWCKNKSSTFGTKFGFKFEYNIVIFEISGLEFV